VTQGQLEYGPANIRLTWKNLRGKNALAYLVSL